MKNDPNQFQWVERFRPPTVDDCILPKSIKNSFQKFVEKKVFTNLLLCGQPGTGKTTVAKALLSELGISHIVINGGLEGRSIDVVKGQVIDFASTVSMSGSGKKCIIFDEADKLNQNSAQPALNEVIERFSRNCGFIFTCNYPELLIPAIHSRCSRIEFHYPKEEKREILSAFVERLKSILDVEKIPYELKALVMFVDQFYPDFRRIINEIQTFSISNGTVNGEILKAVSQDDIKQLAKILKGKQFKKLREWIATKPYSDIDVMNQLYKYIDKIFEEQSIPPAILILNDIQLNSPRCIDKELNTLTQMIYLMGDQNIKFKELEE